MISSPPAPLSAMATSLPPDGDSRIVWGLVAMATGCCSASRTLAQPDVSPAGQTSSTAALLYASWPLASLSTHATSPAPTENGVASATDGPLPASPPVVELWSTGLSVGIACGVMNPPDSVLTPITTTMTAMPDRAPSGTRDPRALRGDPDAPDSRSIADEVRAHRSRGGSGAMSRSARRASRSAANWVAMVVQAAQPARCSSSQTPSSARRSPAIRSAMRSRARSWGESQ